MLQNRRYIDAEVIQNVLLKLKWGLDTRFQNIEQSKSLALCTLLDPRFKLEMFKSDTNKNAIKEHCHELMAGILSRQVPILNTVQVAPNATVSGSSVWNKVDSQLNKIRVPGTPLSKAIREMRLYLDDEILPRQGVDGKWNDPSEWWLRHSKIYPTLAEIYRSRCNIVITSVPCERIFSKAGYILNERRTRLSSSKLEKLVFLNVNSNFVKNKD
ncbi:zinc finger BED domain-containing protein DAYSLEEPER-like [Pararge aegeria]|uniref:zinc finger BED domain-containing protein DAYSLEEPER-like n=1 Tax=Pararge aegeria TaxID=116150 RepID=UPI0019D11C21|nr:zinc finger BED domain-containing protein DAYSLEEPER-like [Pararge aegeria]